MRQHGTVPQYPRLGGEPKRITQQLVAIFLYVPLLPRDTLPPLPPMPLCTHILDHIYIETQLSTGVAQDTLA